MKQVAHFSNEISMVLESPGSCREAIIDGSDSQRCCCEAICALFQRNIYGFGMQEAAVNPLLMVWDLQEVAAKPFTHFLK